MAEAKTGKPTTIRRVTLMAGDKVHFIIGNARYHVERGWDLKIESATIKATNGVSLSFARTSHGNHGPWHWVDNPEIYFVSEAEAETALDQEWAKVPDLLEELAKKLDDQANELRQLADQKRARAVEIREQFKHVVLS